MALPTSGQLSYSQINVELGNGATSVASMLAMATAASKPTSNASVSNFYGYSAGDNIVLAWGTITPYLGQYYRQTTRTGHTSPQIITINFNWNVSYTSDTMYIYTAKNTLSWTTVATIPKSGSGSFTRTLVDYNDVVYVRFDTIATFFANAYCTFNGGTVTSGSGSVSGTAGWNF